MVLHPVKKSSLEVSDNSESVVPTDMERNRGNLRLLTSSFPGLFSCRKLHIIKTTANEESLEVLFQISGNVTKAYATR